ncbi:hypothetical protein F66182_666 [Fusarium sp. NRRL 66182]|nr:hypothetical protein F66182_666 [Fusarium sp. NRRL 66182]
MLSRAKGAASKALNSTVEYVKENPAAAAAIGVGTVVVAAPVIVAAPALAAGGFGANGIVGGSIAAGAQSAIGNVVAPGAFATLQSAAAGGYGVATVHGVVQGVGGAAIACGVKSLFSKAKNGTKPDDTGSAKGAKQDKASPDRGKGEGEGGGEKKGPKSHI